MTKLLPLLLGLLLASCAGGPTYMTKSVPEAKKMVTLEVQYGLIAASQKTSEEFRLCSGKPAEGSWDQAKMDRFFAEWVRKNPRRAEINLAATRGDITEGQRLEQISRIELAEAAARTERAAKVAAIAGALNATGAALNASAASMNQTAAMYNSQPRTIYVAPAPTYTPPKTIYLTPTYGGGYRGTMY